MGYKEDRIKICKACPFYRAHFELLGVKLFKKTAQCSDCKCAIKYKTGQEWSKCPQNKW